MQTPKTRAQVERHPAVAGVKYVAGEEYPWWIYLNAGWTASNDPGQTHQGNGRTLKAAIADVWPIRPCECEDCYRLTRGNRLVKAL